MISGSRRPPNDRAGTQARGQRDPAYRPFADTRTDLLWLDQRIHAHLAAFGDETLAEHRPCVGREQL